MISCFLLLFCFLSSQSVKATLFVPAQGDAGLAGLLGTSGPAGKAVSTSCTCEDTAVTFGSPLWCHCVISLSHLRVIAENRASWDPSDRLVNLWVLFLLESPVLLGSTAHCNLYFRIVVSSSQGAVGRQGPIGSSGKPGARVSNEHKSWRAHLDLKVSFLLIDFDSSSYLFFHPCLVML